MTMQAETVNRNIQIAYWVGKRVEIHPGTDRWMMGDRYGEVSGLSANALNVRVKLDKSGKSIRQSIDEVTLV